jgi:hypothetical protein
MVMGVVEWAAVAMLVILSPFLLLALALIIDTIIPPP